MPVIPQNYTGVPSSLSDVYIIEEELIEVTEDDPVIPELALQIGIPVISTLVFCCFVYCLCSYCAKRSHRVTFLQEKEKEEKRRE